MTLPADQNLDQFVESAVIVAWEELMRAGKPALIHIKYRFAEDHAIANLQVWISETRGHWLLVCECSSLLSTQQDTRLTFSNKFRSETLSQLLEFVIVHQTGFARAPELNRDSLVQVQRPTADDKARALKLVTEALAPEMLHCLAAPASSNFTANCSPSMEANVPA